MIPVRWNIQCFNRCALITALLLAFCAALSLNATAEVVEIEGAGYRVDKSMTENLQAHVGKRITVTLDSGTTVGGRVKAVGKTLLHLEELDGKEYFDALVRIEEILAFETRFREYKR